MSTLSNYSNLASLYLRRDNINLTQLKPRDQYRKEAESHLSSCKAAQEMRTSTLVRNQKVFS